MAEDKKKEIYKLMENDVSLISNVNCVLSRLWRLSLYNLDVRAPIWEALFQNYIYDLNMAIGKSKATNLKGNIPKDLAKDKMTWERFCQGLSVFNFEDVRFSMELTENGETKRVSINIPIIHEQNPGEILRVLWDLIHKEYPEKIGEDWPKLQKAYERKFKEETGKVPEWLKSNLKRALVRDSMMWNMFYRGLMVCAFDNIKMEVALKPKGRPYELVYLNLR
ncbi:hypothetical protein [Vibrio phage vB_VmeM-Yong XC32]|nr:hypothetical protein [Vibrio phage vB_VmeM-Yong XC31]QAX96456.1 hypothetical protein [Vibrio phage vB_VmeM-Yong XC32]QAX96773.1 hypothetical protein [Vibrio phage vB_VmeM-Yong MS31]QAX97092.1 hypothetical protein [Vibrio phage vB_VmeM-Yong MS32]